jgi:hypothetical protein
MQSADMPALSAVLHGFYEEQFPGLNRAMTALWLEHLRQIDADIVHVAVRRWATHHNHKPPSLDEVLEQVEYVREDRRRTLRQGSSATTFPKILQDAAETQAANPLRSDDDVLYGHLMATLGIRSCGPWQDEAGQSHPKLTLEQRSEQCYAWATQYQTSRPALARDLQAAARQFAEAFYTTP